jgi:hypothetical protein
MMAFYVNTPNESQIMSALQTWIMEVLTLDINHVIAGYNNIVAPPTGDYAIMSKISMAPLSTPWIAYTDTKVLATESETSSVSMECVYQIDCYGPNAADHIMILFTLLRSDATSEWFTAYNAANGITLDTFYTENPTRSVLTNEEAQYEDHWLLRMRLDVVQQVSTSVNFMDAAVVKPIINVHTLP